MTIEQRFPHVAAWVREHGWIEIGQDEFSASFMRVLEGGGMVWEGATSYASIEHALAAAEAGIERWMEQQGMRLDRQDR